MLAPAKSCGALSWPTRLMEVGRGGGGFAEVWILGLDLPGALMGEGKGC